MSDLALAFVEESRKFLTQDFLPKIEKCVESLTDQDVWWRPNEASNSIGNLILHLSGNVRQWIVSGIGKELDQRVRQQEFDERHQIPKDELLSKLKKAVLDADVVLSKLSAEKLLDKELIQGREVTILYAVYHVVEHFSMHTGQIILITKTRTEKDLAFYELKSGIPKAQW
ncbi:MAG: DUF1572 family protein [Blastocatellia bacterium]|nr:DUF1572 family protein [Blastocatellia bacterium]